MTLQKRYVRSTGKIYLLDELEVPKAEVSPEVAHHIMVVDRSGSMYYDIDKLKQSIEQALTVDSFVGNEHTLTTLISFSSHGDVKLHWSKVPIADVVKMDSPYVRELRGIRATYLTGISQGLELALQQVNSGQTTGITLFTDGYANHPSPSAENRALDAFVAKAKTKPGLFLNCIGYRDWCDWPRMKAMSNALSGTTVKARSFGHVLETMKGTQELLSGGVKPAVTFEAGGTETFVLAINKSTGQVNSSARGAGLTMVGLSESDEIEAWRVTELPSTDRGPRGATALKKAEAWRTGALISALVTKLDLRAAKDLLFVSGNKTLWEAHQSAATPSTLAEMLNDLNFWVRAQSNDMYKMGRNTKPKYSLFDFAEAMNQAPQGSIALSNTFYANYRRRSEKRIPGKRLDDGTIQPPNATSKSGTAYVRGMSFNTTEATVQLETAAALELFDRKGKRVWEVEMVSLKNLTEYRSYTVMSSGERNVDTIPLVAVDRRGVKALAPFLTPAKAKKLQPGGTAVIELRRFGMGEESLMNLSDVTSAVLGLHEATAEVKFLSAAHDKARTSDFGPGQLEALRELHLTPALYFSPPTTPQFADQDEAIQKGWLDSYTRYTVNFGTVDILNSGAFRSANAFLARWYTVMRDGEEIKKPKLVDVYYDDKVTFQLKEKRRGADTSADLLMAKVFERRLGKERLGPESVGQELKRFKSIVDNTYADLAPLVMQIGCTGLLPAHLANAMPRLEPEGFSKTHGVKLKAAESEGVFYDNGTVVISIVPKTGWYTTDAGLAAK